MSLLHSVWLLSQELSQGLKSVSGFDPSLLLRACNFGGIRLLLYCCNHCKLWGIEVSAECTKVKKKRKKCACLRILYMHSNRTNGYLLNSKAMNNLANLNLNTKQTNATGWSYFVQNVILCVCWMLLNLHGTRQGSLRPKETGSQEQGRFPFYVCCAKFVLEDPSISSHWTYFFSLPMSINTILSWSE